MADENDIRGAEQLRDIFSERRDLAYEILEASREQAKQAKLNTQEVQDYLSYSRAVVKTLTDQAGLVDKLYEQTVGTKELTKEQEKLIERTNRLKSQESALSQRAVLLEAKRREQIGKMRDAIARGRTDEAAYYRVQVRNTGEQVDTAKSLVQATKDQVDNLQAAIKANEELVELSKEADKRTRGFSALADLTKSIPGLRKLSGPFQEAQKAARGAALSGKKGFAVFKAGAGQLAKSFMGPAGIASAVILIGKKLLEINSATVDFARTMNTTSVEAGSLRRELTNSADSLDYMNERLDGLRKRIASFTNQFGVVANTLGPELLTTAENIQNKFGLSEQSANILAKQILVAGGNAEQFRGEILGAAEATELSLGINLQQQAVLNDVVNTSERIKMIFKDNVPALAAAVVQARSLGLNLSQVDSIADSLLDFESSISAELEAELLTGRELNLERARLYALTNDYNGLIQELTANIGSGADFSKMTRIEQEAIAKTFGMQADQLSKVYYEQEALSRLGVRDREELQKKVNNLIQEKGYRAAIKEFGEDEYARQVALTSIQEKLATLFANLGTILADQIAPEIEKFSNYLENNKGAVNDLVNGFKDFASVAMGVGKVIKFLIIDPIKSVMDIGSGFGQLLKGNFKEGFNTLANISNTSLPLVGPSGTAMGYGAKAIGAIGSKVIEAEDFTIKTHPKDTLVMAGGTKLGNGEASEKTNQLLEKLISAVEKGGDVYIDGNKAGQSLALATYRSS